MVVVSVISVNTGDFQVDHEVMVDVACGMAVLRGANIFTAGILAMSHGNKPSFHKSLFSNFSTALLKFILNICLLVAFLNCDYKLEFKVHNYSV